MQENSSLTVFGFRLLYIRKSEKNNFFLNWQSKSVNIALRKFYKSLLLNSYAEFIVSIFIFEHHSA
jgi:hypothetical protein